MKSKWLGLAALLFVATSVHAVCPKNEEINSIVAAYIAKTPIKPIENLKNILEAYCAQGKLAAQIGRTKGTQAGFKVGYTSLSTRLDTDVDRPLRGFFFQNMFLRRGRSREFRCAPAILRRLDRCGERR
mgnify:CR=1 FL=1